MKNTQDEGLFKSPAPSATGDGERVVPTMRTRFHVPQVALPVLPADVLNRLRDLKDPGSRPEAWTWEKINSTNASFRVRGPQGSWVVKRSRDPAKDRLVAALFRAWAVPTFAIDDLADGWLAMQDLARPTLRQYLLTSMPTPGLVRALGVVAAQADAVGMRDRKTSNILVDSRGAGGVCLTQIDYEGAFRVGLFTRAVRPAHYLAYLIRRLLLDVFARARQGVADAEAYAVFAEGLREEASRLTEAMASQPRWDGLSTRQRIILHTRVCARSNLSSLLDRGLARAQRKGPRP